MEPVKCRETCPFYKPGCFCTCNRPEKDSGESERQYRHYRMELRARRQLEGKRLGLLQARRDR